MWSIVARCRSMTAILTGAVEPVSGIAQTGQNIPMIVQLRVNRGGPDGYLGMLGMQPRQSLLTGQHAYEAQLTGAVLLQPVDRRNRGVAGGQHRINGNDKALVEARGCLEV